MFKNASIKATGVSPKDYHARNKFPGDRDFIMSPSALKKFSECPEEWLETSKEIRRLTLCLNASADRAEREFFREEIDKLEGTTNAQKFGNLADTLALTPQFFDSVYAVRPEQYDTTVLKCPKCGSETKAAKCRKCNEERIETKTTLEWNGRADECKVWIDEQFSAGKKVISRYEHERGLRAAARLLRKPAIKKCIEVSDKQVHVVGEWHDECGIVIPVQCLIDLVPSKDAEYVPGVEMMWPKTLVDMKTSYVAELQAFTRNAFRFGHHIQGAFDLDIYREATGEDRTDWLLICQKNYGVFQPFKRFLPADFIAIGKASYVRMLHNYALCLKTNRWPDHDDCLDESICGFGVCTPEPWFATQEQFAPRLEIQDEPEEESEEPEVNKDEVVP